MGLRLSGQSATALGATFAKHRTDRAPQEDVPLQVTTPITVSVNTNVVQGYNAATGKYYGTSTVNGHYITTTDGITFTDRTYAPSTFTPNLIGWQFDATYMYAYSSDGRVWRAPLDTFNSWTEITVSDKGGLTTGRPGSLCAVGSGVLIYGNYTSAGGDGAHLWRSTDAGATWTHVLDLAGAKHIHCVRLSTNLGALWCTVGDASFTGIGLYKSTNNGLTWTLMSSNDYGIDMVFVPALGERPDLILLEGDGLNRPHIMGFPETGSAGDKTVPMIWFRGAPSDPYSTRGTVRGIALTPNGDLIYVSTNEAAVVGTRAGIWIAQGPDFTRAVLLKETTNAEQTYGRTFVIGTNVFNNGWKFTLPTFGSY